MRKILISLLIMGLSTNLIFADRGTAGAKAILVGASLESDGYTVRDIPGRHLRSGHYRTYNRYLYSGSCYAIVGVGDDNVRDLDVVVWDGNWNRVASDRDSSDISAVKICPRWSGTFHIRTTMYRGSGYFYQVIAYK